MPGTRTLALAALATACSACQASTLILFSAYDARIRSDTPTFNYGADPELSTYNSGLQQRTLLRFGPFPPRLPTDFREARLRLRAFTGSGFATSTARVFALQRNWDERSVTWLRNTATSTWNIQGAGDIFPSALTESTNYYDTTRRVHEFLFDATDLPYLTGQAGTGLLLTPADTSQVYYDSSDSTGTPPELMINYGSYIKSTTFQTGSEGWVVGDMPMGGPYTPANFTNIRAVTWTANGPLGRGAISANNTSGKASFLRVPNSYAGDPSYARLRDYVGGRIRFFARANSGSSNADLVLLIQNINGEIYKSTPYGAFTTSATPTGQDVDLLAANFVKPDGTTPSASEFEGMLTNNVYFYIPVKMTGSAVCTYNSFSITPPRSQTFQINFQDFSGDPFKEWVVADLVVGSGTTVDETHPTYIQSGQQAVVYPKSKNAGRSWRIKGRFTLSKLIPADTTIAKNYGAISLINGDLDGDNAITVFDYAVLSDYFDDTETGTPTWEEFGVNGSRPADADLDGDGAVTVFDYDIISRNFDLVGE